GCADLIRGRLRSPDLLAHLGNGMFALVLPESPLGAARGICARILPELHRLAGVAFKNKAIDVAKDGRSAQAVLQQRPSVQPANQANQRRFGPMSRAAVRIALSMRRWMPQLRWAAALFFGCAAAPSARPPVDESAMREAIESSQAPQEPYAS